MPTLSLQPHTAAILPFPAMPAAVRDVPAGDAFADHDAIVSVLLALEDAPSAVIVRACRTVDSARRVHVAAGDFAAILTPAQARLAAQAMFGEQAFAGCCGVAAELFDTAAHAETGVAPPVAHGRTGLGALVGFAALALFVLVAFVWPTAPVQPF